jgi:hypothetical protein
MLFGIEIIPEKRLDKIRAVPYNGGVEFERK